MTAPLLAVLMAVQFDSVPKPRTVMAISQVALINTFVNRMDAWVFKQDWARSGTRVWGEHLRLGWEWDEDAFTTNMFAHPYHGGLYFNAARANGLGFFQAVPYAIMGSWTWEYFGEKYRPSLNDWYMTSFGGITLGEVFHRIGATIRDNGATGRGRTLRELAALPMDPIGSLNRLARGQWRARGVNPPEHDPGSYVFRIGVGARFAKGLIADSGAARMGAMLVDLLYGDPFATEYRSPFDVFGVRLMLSSNGGFSSLRASGRIYGTNLNNPSRRARHVLAVNTRYDFFKNRAQSVGGQSVEIGINSRWPIGSRGYAFRTSLFVDGILLGAIDASGTGLGTRTYDFGPGGGARWEFGFDRHGARFVRVFGQWEYIHAVSGASADHIVDFSGIEANIPIGRGFGIAAHSTVFHRISRYSTAPKDERNYPEARLLLVWTKASGLKL